MSSSSSSSNSNISIQHHYHRVANEFTTAIKEMGVQLYNEMTQQNGLPGYTRANFNSGNNRAITLTHDLVAYVHQTVLPSWWPTFANNVYNAGWTNVLDLFLAIVPLLLTARLQNRVAPGDEVIDPHIGIVVTTTSPTRTVTEKATPMVPEHFTDEFLAQLAIVKDQYPEEFATFQEQTYRTTTTNSNPSNKVEVKAVASATMEKRESFEGSTCKRHIRVGL